jgi:hypothetical protein
MRRREFIALVGGTAAAWPLAAQAQQPAIRVIGYLSSRSPAEAQTAVNAFAKRPRRGRIFWANVQGEPENSPRHRQRRLGEVT